MIVELFTILCIFPLFYFIAYLFKPLINLNTFSEQLLSGLVICLIISQIYVFFLPLNLYFTLGITVLAILGLVKYLKDKHLKEEIENFKIIFKNPFLWIFICLILFFGSGYPFINDYFGYYIPTIKWQNEYGLIKGIANLSFILGQQSSWHSLQASINPIFDIYNRLNVYLTIIFLIYIFEHKKWIFFIFLPLFYLYLSATSPDLPLMIFALIIVYKSFQSSQNLLFLFILSWICFIIKPLLFILPVWVCYLAFQQKEFIKLKQFSLIALGFLLLFSIKNIWLSGLIFFPLNYQFINVQWVVSPKILEISASVAILKHFDFQYTLSEIDSWNQWAKFYKWLTLSGIKGVMNQLVVISIIGFLIYALIKKNKSLIVLAILFIINGLIIYLVSGQYRFFLPIMVCIIYLLFKTYNHDYLKYIVVFISILMIFGMFKPGIITQKIPSFQAGFFMRPYEISCLLKPGIYSQPAFSKQTKGNLTYYKPIAYPLTYNLPLPAISEYEIKEYDSLNIFPQLIKTSEIEKGFYMKP